jgi:hypothetical protein
MVLWAGRRLTSSVVFDTHDDGGCDEQSVHLGGLKVDLSYFARRVFGRTRDILNT